MSKSVLHGSSTAATARSRTCAPARSGATCRTRGTSELLSRETHAGGEKRFYDYDSMGDRQGQQVTDGASSRYRSYTKDANGSVLGLEDDDGDVAHQYDYDPYGELETTPSGDAADNPFRFEGFYYDSGVRSYDMRARAYRPEHGRFLTQDRYASASQDLLMQADPLTQNRYAFAGANPVNNIEFDGHVRSVPGGGGGHPKPCRRACQKILDTEAHLRKHGPPMIAGSTRGGTGSGTSSAFWRAGRGGPVRVAP